MTEPRRAEPSLARLGSFPALSDTNLVKADSSFHNMEFQFSEDEFEFSEEEFKAPISPS
jgi:hypothetical protein